MSFSMVFYSFSSSSTPYVLIQYICLPLQCAPYLFFYTSYYVFRAACVHINAVFTHGVDAVKNVINVVKNSHSA